MKIIGYARVSTTAQDLERQRELINDFCKKNNYNLSSIIEDNGISGAINDRQGYNRLLSLTKDDADMVVVSELSRISRSEDFILTLTNIYSLLAKDIDLILLDEPNRIYSSKDRLDFMQFMEIAFKAYGAAEERKKIRERIVTGKLTKLANNPLSVCPKKAPLGFTKKDGLLIPNDEEVPIIQDIFNMIVNGTSLTNTAKYITYYGHPISNAQISNIIHNTIYIGKRTIKGKVYEIPYKLIPEDLFYRANETLKDRDHRKSNFTRHYNPLKGILKCACGGSMYLDTTYGSNFYRCYYKKKYHNCNNQGISAKLLLEAVWTTVKDNLNKQNDMKKLSAINKDLLKLYKALQTANKKKNNKKSEMYKLISKKDTLDDMLRGIVNDKIVSLQNEVNEINKDIERLNTTIANKSAETAVYRTKYNIKDISEKGKGNIYKEVLKSVIYDNGVLQINFINGLEINLIRKNNRFIVDKK